MEEDETFDKIYAHFYDVLNSLYNLGRSIDVGKKIETILASLYHYFNSKFMTFETL